MIIKKLKLLRKIKVNRKMIWHKILFLIKKHD